MSVERHNKLVGVARSLCEPLTHAIEQNGVLSLEPQQSTPPFAERLCRAVAGQQLSVKAAASIWGRVVASANDTALIEHVLTVKPEALRACGLSGAKVKAMRAIAQAADQGQLNATELSTLSHTGRTQRLTRLWGVGQWTADMMGIFYFGDEDIWPDGDVTARKTLEKLTSKRRGTTRTAARFAPYRSYLALHMWRYVDAAPD